MSKEGRLSMFRAFQSRNYALYFTGQSISLIGTWMQRTGVSWVVYTMTHSAFMLGLTIFASQFPSFLFSLFGGILADRYNRHKIILITQTASLVQAVLLAILALSNHYVVWEILALSAILGIINAFDVPARQPLIHELVTDKRDLPNALALNSSMANVARLVGPALSGIILEAFGAGFCFLLNAFSFLAVIFSLLTMKLSTYEPRSGKRKATQELAEGFMYIRKTPAIGMVLLLLSVVSLLVLPYDTLLPVFAKVIFSGNATTFGYITSCIGLGAVVGTFFLASLKPGTDLKFVLLINTLILGVGMMLFSHMNNFPLAMLFGAIFGFGAMSQTTICLTLIQIHSAPEMRGRVMSYVAMGFFGMLPLGSLIVGGVSQSIGAPNTLLVQGVMALIIAGVFSTFLRKDRLSKKDEIQVEVAQDQVMNEL